MNVNVAGMDHDTPLELREKIAFSADEAQQALQDLRDSGISAVLISTCNRTEIWCEDADATKIMRRFKDAAPDALYTYKGDNAARHLFRVAAGLESRLVGEDQILAQVKDAIEAAQRVGTSSPMLNQLFRCAVSAAKEVKTNVPLCSAPMSAPQSAIDMARGILGELSGLEALVIGSGVMGRMCAEILLSAGANVSVTMRKVSHRRVASTLIDGAAYIDYEERRVLARSSDIVVSATASPHFTLRAEDLEGMSASARVFIDLAVPRDMDPAIEDIEGVTLIDIDDIGGGEIEGEAQAMKIWGRYEKRLYDWINGRRIALRENIKSEGTYV